MASPVRSYAKEGWHSVSSRVTGPQSFDQMVWPYAWGCVGLGRSHGRRGTGQTRVGFVHQRFPSSQHHRAVFDPRFIPPGKFSKTINRNAHYILAFKNPRDQTGIRTILLQAFPDRWRQVLRLFKRITSRPFGYLMLDVHPASDDRYRLWSHLTPEKVKRKSIPCSWMSLPFENALQRERERQRRQREGGQHTDLSARMDTPTLSPAGVGSPSAPPLSLDLSSMTDMVTELTRPVDRAQLDQEIEDFNLSSSFYRLWQAPAPPRPPPNPSPLPPKQDPSRPPKHAPSPPPPPPPTDRIPSRPPEHVLSPPPQRAPSPLVDVQAQGPPPPPPRR